MSDQAEVLIVGAGPVGLTAAHELARRGVRVRVIDAAEGPATSSRALALHARTMEMCHLMGMAGDMLARGRRVEHFTMHMNGRQLIRFDTNYLATPTRFPFSLMIDQMITEEVLRKHVQARGVKIEWGVQLVDFKPQADHVTARLRSDGNVTEVSTPWLVGADGAHSAVRRGLGLRLLGDATETWLNADVILGADIPGDSNHLLHCGRGTLLLVPFPEPGKWRVVDTLDVTGSAEEVRSRMARKISRALGQDVSVSAPSWMSVFTVQQRMIERMRVGRCLLAGDAAHVHSPASGQGMNTGMQDACNLAWKLADVVHGHAGEELLDSYTAERVPVGAVLLRTTRTATALVALRNALLPAVLPVGLGFLRRSGPLKRRIEGKIIRGFSALTLNYSDGPLSRPAPDRPRGIQPGWRVGCTAGEEQAAKGWRGLLEELTDPRWTLLGFGTGGALDEVGRLFGAAVSVRTVGEGPNPLPDPDRALTGAFGLREGDYALVRPDGYLAGKGPLPADMTGLLTGFGLRPASV